MEKPQPPPAEQVNEIERILLEHGVSLPPDILLNVVGVTNFWYANYKAGWDMIEKTCPLEISDASDGFRFQYQRKPVASRRVQRVTGFLVDGLLVNPREVEFEERDDIERCSGCGVPCPHAVDADGQILCSQCLKLVPANQAYGDVPDCDQCTFALCDNHPSNIKPLKLVGGA